MYSLLNESKNMYTTTIHVLVSAVQKIARVMKLPSGLKLYRGLGGSMDLPDSFYKSDKNGFKGFVEWGFISTTADKQVAIQYSGVMENAPLPIILEMEVEAVDRGACIRDFSQFPQEVIYLFFFEFYNTIIHLLMLIWSYMPR